MKCTKCGAELPEGAKTCESCKTPVEGQPESGGKNKKIVPILIGGAAVLAVGAFAAVKMTEKDPKEVVIGAFEKIYETEKPMPVEELFGVSGFADTALTTSVENGLTLKLDSASDEMINAYAGSGLRFESKNDVESKKSSFDMEVIYNGMDLAGFTGYYGDEILMLGLPGLSERVFTLDLGEGLEERIVNSPTVGPLLEENNVNVAEISTYLSEMIEAQEQAVEEGKTAFDFGALLERYKEGCKAQDNFEAAWIVEKGDKADYEINGKNVSCRGYSVTISKDAIINFLRESSDFFLQDETLKQDFLKQLEFSVNLSNLMGAQIEDSLTAEQVQQETYDELKASVDEAITELEASLEDVQMQVYVDKKGSLAALEGTTAIHSPEGTAPETVQVSFSALLKGGSYPTQNMDAKIELVEGEDTVALSVSKAGTYDGKKLTSDIKADVTSVGSSVITLSYSGAYNSEDGSYSLSLNGSAPDSQLFEAAAKGVIDELEKGKAVHLSIDELNISVMDDLYSAVLSGEYYLRPLSGEVVSLEGTQMDMLAATEEDWSNVLLEIVFGAMALGGQVSAPVE